MDAWGDMEEETFFDAPSEAAPQKVTSASNPFDDNGEPDFAGWLAAQAGKKPGAKPLPKGLAKPAAARPANAGRSATTGSVGATGTKKAATTTTLKPKPAVAKKIDTTPKAGADDEEWGDGW